MTHDLSNFRTCRPGAVKLPRLHLADIATARQFATGLGATLNGYQFGTLSEEDTTVKLTALGMDEAVIARVIEAARKRKAGKPSLGVVR